jgi:hypothetical protein
MAKNQVGTDKWARLRVVAAEDAKEVDSAVAEVADALGVMADALSNLREHLDLIEAPKSASLKVRIATARKYATAFRRIAEEAPEIVADAISEVYHSLDDVAGAIENLAENMGIELELTPAEEAFGEEGKEEIAEGEKPEDAPEPKVDEEKFEKAEDELESEEAEPAEEKLDEAEESVEKEASAKVAGQVMHDAIEQLKAEGKLDTILPLEDMTPVQQQLVAQRAREIQSKIGTDKKADAAFITDRDENAAPEPVEKAEIPEAQGKAASTRSYLRLRIAKRHGIQL